MPQYLYRIQPTRPAMLREGPTSQESAQVAAHFAYLQEQDRLGRLILAGRTLNTDDSSFGVVIFRAADEGEARGIMLADPAVHAGVMRAELYPYRVALMSPEHRGDEP